MSNQLWQRRGPVFGIEQAAGRGPTSGLGNPYRAAEAAGLEGGHGPVVSSLPEMQAAFQQRMDGGGGHSPVAHDGAANPYRAAEAAGLEGGHGPVVHNSPPDSQQMMQQLLQLMQQMLQHTGG